MKRFVPLALPLLMAFVSPALAQAPAATDAANKAAKDPNKVVCHEEDVTGSRLATTRECHTNAEWQEIQRQQRSDISRTQSQGGH